jgi:hypothetical protein
VMGKAFVTLHGGLGNQLFQAALVLWLRDARGIDAKLIDPGGRLGIPGPYTRVCQINEILIDEHIQRGPLAILLHLLSLSSKWQALFGRFGLVKLLTLPSFASCADLLEFNKVLSGNKPMLSVFLGYWQEPFILSATSVEMQKLAHPVLKKRLFHIDQMLLRSGRPCINETLVVHVRRGDLTKINSAILLGSSYYKSAFAALEELHATKRLKPKAIGVVSDEPDVALPLIQALQPSAYVIDLEDPLDALAAISFAHSRFLANSTLSIWGGVLSSADSPTFYPALWDLEKNQGARLCQSFNWSVIDGLGLDHAT